jgi:hypothetical protein
MKAGKLLLCFFIAGVFFLFLQGCGSKPYACMAVESTGDSAFVNRPVSLNAFCSTNAGEYNWEINHDSTYFTPRITLTFTHTGEQDIYLLVTKGGKAAGASRKLIVYP